MPSRTRIIDEHGWNLDEADAMLSRLLPGGEIPYRQWYHMPDRKHPGRALRPLSTSRRKS